MFGVFYDIMARIIMTTKNEQELRLEFEKALQQRKNKKYYKAEFFFKALKFSKYGVPLLSQEKIETLAEVFLDIYASNVLSIPQDTPLLKIVNELIDQKK
jgi:hypothetical protein